MLPNGSELYLNDSRGIYIPQAFATITKRECVSGVSQEDWNVLEDGPEHEWYWETWSYVEQNAVLTDPSNGKRFTLYQDGDLWIIPEGAEWPED